MAKVKLSAKATQCFKIKSHKATQCLEVGGQLRKALKLFNCHLLPLAKFVLVIVISVVVAEQHDDHVFRNKFGLEPNQKFAVAVVSHNHVHDVDPICFGAAARYTVTIGTFLIGLLTLLNGFYYLDSPVIQMEYEGMKPFAYNFLMLFGTQYVLYSIVVFIVPVTTLIVIAGVAVLEFCCFIIILAHFWMQYAVISFADQER